MQRKVLKKIGIASDRTNNTVNSNYMNKPVANKQKVRTTNYKNLLQKIHSGTDAITKDEFLYLQSIIGYRQALAEIEKAKLHKKQTKIEQTDTTMMPISLGKPNSGIKNVLVGKEDTSSKDNSTKTPIQMKTANNATQTNKQQLPKEFNTPTKKIEWYIQELGFTTAGTSDNKGRVENSSALIVIQWYMIKNKNNEEDPCYDTYENIKLNGKVDDRETLKALEAIYNYKISKKQNPKKVAKDVMKYAKANWKSKKPSLGTDRYSSKNGHLETNDMVDIPSLENERGKFAVAEKNAGVAWAMMVQGAVEYNNKKKHTKDEIKNYGKKLDTGMFIVTGPDSGYRDYHMQVEALLDWTRRGSPESASPVTFKYASKHGKYGSGQEEFNKLVNKLGKLPANTSGGWDNIPDSYTDPKKDVIAPIDGSGTSRHGLGAALDLNFGMEKKESIGTTNKNGVNNKTRHWTEDYGRDYGFEGLYNDGSHFYKE